MSGLRIRVVIKIWIVEGRVVVIVNIRPHILRDKPSRCIRSIQVVVAGWEKDIVGGTHRNIGSLVIHYLIKQERMYLF